MTPLGGHGKSWSNPVRKSSSRFWLQWFGRAGYAGRGLFYIIVGACAMAAALLARHNNISEPAILRYLLGHFWGVLVIALIGAAFAANAVWFCYIGLMRQERPRRYIPPWALHVGNLAMSLLFAVLAVIVGALLFGWAPGRVHAIQQIAVMVMRLGWIGRAAAAFAGAVTIGAGLFQIYEAWAEDFRRQLDLHHLGRLVGKAIVLLARIGWTARGTVIALIGMFLLIAAVKGNPRDAVGPAQSLRKLQYEPFGPVLLGIIAMGLMAFGLWMLIEAWLRRDDPL